MQCRARSGRFAGEPGVDVATAKAGAQEINEGPCARRQVAPCGHCRVDTQMEHMPIGQHPLEATAPQRIGNHERR